MGNSATLNNWGYLTISTGGTANNTTVNNYGSMSVSEGGIANSTTVNTSGEIKVYNGGTANSALLRSGFLHVHNGGVASHIDVECGVLKVSDGGYVSQIILHGVSNRYDGDLYVLSNGLAEDVLVEQYGDYYVSSGGTANKTTVNSTGNLYVSSGGTANSIKENGGYVDIADGANVTFITNTLSELVLTNASATIHSGTTAISAMIENGGRINVYEKSYADSTTVFSGGIMELFEGGSANHAIVKLGGQLHLSSGATVTKPTVYSNGVLHVSSGGTATGVVAASGARLELYAASNTLISGTSGGKTFEFKDGNVSGFVFENGILNVQDGGTAQDLTIGSGGSLFVSNGNAMDIAVKSKGLFQLNRGTASNVEIESGGTLSITKGGKLTGIINITTGARVTMSADSELYFDISALTPDKSVAIVNDLSLITGTPDYTFISSDAQIQGKYTLAYGASLFTGAITIKTQNDDFLGILGVGESFSTSNASYSLSLNNGELALEIDTIKPIITLSGNNTVPVQAATLTASTEPGLDIYFSQDNENWMKYVGEIAITDNITYYFKATDANGNIGTNWICFTNIDKVPPEKPTASADVTTPTKEDVFVSAQFSADSVVMEYSLDGGAWTAYKEPIKFTENGAVRFRGIDQAGNESEITSYEVTNIIKTPPSKPVIVADVTTPTNGDVLVSATFSEDSFIKEYSLDGKEWIAYTESVKFTENGAIRFRAFDNVGNMSEEAFYEVSNIDKVSPEKPYAFADVTTMTNANVLVSATFSVDSTEKKYSLNGKDWLEYKNPVEFTENGIVNFLGVDAAGNESEVVSYTVGNIDKVAPSDPVCIRALVEGQDVALLWNASVDDFSGVKEYIVTYLINGQEFVAKTGNTNYVLNNADIGSYSWSVQAVDFAGNESAVTAGDAFVVSGFRPYTVEYSPDNFEHVITFAVTTPSLDAFRMPGGIYQLRVKQEGSSEWLTGDSIVAEDTGDTPQLVKSDADGNADVFFANTVGTWESAYLAQHVGSIGDWGGTNEYATLYGKNKLADIIDGSTDANILLMTDDNNGDGLFVDDIYSDSPNELGLSQSRIAQIDEIRAGFGDDIVDMTSQRFAYIGTGLTIRGGAGNDTIWANKGDNWLFGDAGNDRIVGASGNEVITGGIGNDRMHGGGGDDIFTFCDNWGVDNVEQLEGGSITLWFASGDESKWNADTLTYTDGVNSVKVTGVTSVDLKFGDDGTEQYATLAQAGAFFDATSERIFEESGKGMLATL